MIVLLTLLATFDLLYLLLWCLPALIAVIVYHSFFAQKRLINAEEKTRLETQLLNRLSIKHNDLQCQKRWLNQFDADDEMHTQRQQHIDQLQREIRLLEQELATLHED